jgi:hypothetical protein
MRAMLDVTANVCVVPPPMCTYASVLVAAEKDIVIKSESTMKLRRFWGDEVEVRWLPGGHASGV